MIYELSRDIAENLLARKFPVRVEFGPQIAQLDSPGYIIRFERDFGKTDAIDAAKGSQANPQKKRVRTLAAFAKIFAFSDLPGAHVGDHERMCEQLVDALIVELVDWGTAGGAGVIPFTEGRYLAATELNEIETWPGVVYLLRFGVPRGLDKRDFNNAPRPTGAAAGVRGAINISRDGTQKETVPTP